MSLDAALSIASGSLANINRQLALVSQNVANAGTAGYAREVGEQTSVTADGTGMGVHSGAATRVTDGALQQTVRLQDGVVSGLQTRQAALQAIDTALGTPGQGTDLSSLVGALQDAFATLSSAPDNQAAQRSVVSNAATLATAINTVSDAYQTQRQAAQDAVVAQVGTLNRSLTAIGSLSRQIIGLQAAGKSTADLESQRDTAVQTLAGLVGIRTLDQPNGDLLVVTSSGLSLPTDGSSPFSTAAATIGAASTYPGGGIPPITLGGSDVTGQLAGGALGANIALRDGTLPTDQAELDEFAQNLSSRFDAQGLRLFTDPNGNVPASNGTPVQANYVGYAGIIGVNPAVTASAALVRDGTQAVVGSPTGPSAFTPNPAGGPAGFATMIARVLDYTFGTQAQSGVPQPASAVSGLGAAGTLAAPYSAPATLGATATALTAAQSADSADASGQLATEAAVQTTLTSRLGSETGVSMDTEMSTMVQLQNAYGANARIITAAQSMWNQLLSAVQ